MKSLLFNIPLITLSLIGYSQIGYSQSSLVLNNDGYINIQNDAFLVIDNESFNAITVTGTGGNILSEDENNVLKWNIGNSTGNYIIPYTNPSGIKIPLEVNITDAGNVGGSFLLSTYQTTNLNTPWPNGVTNMNSPFHPTDASNFVIDRFWRIDCNSFTTKPGAKLSFRYDYNNEAGGTNFITEASLQAQRFNQDISDWELLMFGTVNTITKSVEDVVVPPNTFYKDWTLINNSKPLPITLLNFESECKTGQPQLNWSTASENDNDYFVIDKSINGYSFHEIAKVQGAGNSNTLINYSYRDNTPSKSTVYYRLKQVDFNGKEETFNIISANCTSDNNFIVSQELLGDNSLNFNIRSSTDQSLKISLYDISGKLISSETTTVKEGSNQIEMSDLFLVKGIYLLNIIGNKNHYAAKLFKK